jgi:hypothetical protein
VWAAYGSIRVLAGIISANWLTSVLLLLAAC